MNYASLKACDVANGTGVRVSLFVSGCRHACQGCFNQEAWDFNYGKPFTQLQMEELLGYLKPAYIEGLTLLGGEPLEPENQGKLLEIVKQVKSVYPNKTIWLYSGFTYHDEIQAMMNHPEMITKELMSYIDVLVDGRFVLEQKQLNLKFRGSKNQRIIDLVATRAQNQLTFIEDALI